MGIALPVFNRTKFADSNLEVGIFNSMDILRDISNKSFENIIVLEREIEKGLTDRSNLEKDEPAGFNFPGVVFGEIPSKYNAREYLKAAVGWVYAAVSAISDAVAYIQQVNLGVLGLDEQLWS